MSDLLERTRAVSLERVREVRRVLSAERRATSEAIEAALRELHAIKGETAMVGLKLLSRIAHALESLLVARRRSPSPELGDALDALRVLSEVLASAAATELNDSADLDDLLNEIQAAVGEPESSRSTPRPEPDASAADERGHSASAAAESQASQLQRTPGGPHSEAPAAPAVRSPRAGGGERGWSRVENQRLDELSGGISEVAAELKVLRRELRELAGELGGASNQSSQSSQSSDEPGSGASEKVRSARTRLHGVNERFDGMLTRIAQAEERAFALRLVAVTPLLEELADHVEGLSGDLGKSVRVRVDAGGVALERGLVDALREPLLHLCRNAIDHGIEGPEARGSKDPTGTIVLSVESQGAETVLAVRDDGSGIDVDRLRRRAVEEGMLSRERAQRMTRDEVVELVFAHGFSQRREVTELSGRGVGLSAVRRTIEDLGGAVRIESSSGGTAFELVLPGSMARERVLLVESLGLIWAIPSRWVRHVVRDAESLAQARETGILRTQEGLSAARPLANWLGGRREEATAAVVVEIAHRRIALLVAGARAEVELLRRPSDPISSRALRITGSAALADGGTAFFLRWAEVLREVTLLEEAGAGARQLEARRPRVLVADDSPVIRDIVGDILSGAGVEVTAAEDGRVALEWIGKAEFDLVISDVEMPHMNGLELLTRIRQRSRLLPVVMLTTRSTPEHRREAALLGANAYIAKSEFQGDTLLTVARRFVNLTSWQPSETERRA
ncbi:MAG TPA: response regulator [Polyangiaceae bacterium]|nr:response regulator [Polyangiaceae bacterium]